MKKVVLFTIGLLITLTTLSQKKVKVFNVSNIYFAMIIPDGEKFILEEYDNFKYNYQLSTDTSELINDSIFLKSARRRISLDKFSKEYDFCDTKINKIRNSSLSIRINRMLQDSINKYVGSGYSKLKLSFEQDFKENVCSDTFASIVYKRFDNQINKIKEIYESKMRRVEWIKKNHTKIDNDYIVSFLVDFYNNEPDEEAFIQILIANPVTLIEAIDKLDMRYHIVWRVKWIKNIEGISKAIESLENTDLKGRIKRQLLRELKKNKG